MDIITFMKHLKTYRAPLVFNPWRDYEPGLDIGPEAPVIRYNNFQRYLELRREAHYLFVAEGLGYQGGHFSGIPMTSERLLLGHLRHKGLGPEMVFDPAPRRTSSKDVKPDGFTEPTATIVWGAMHDMGIDPRSVILWNAFPWHPYKPDKGFLSNRTPTDEEVMLGRPVLLALTAYAPEARILAVGQKSAALLAAMGITAPALRHPANGGAGLFRTQFAKVLKKGRG